MRYGFCCVMLLAGCTSDNPLYIGGSDGGGGNGDGALAGDGGTHDAAVGCPPACNTDLPFPISDLTSGAQDLSQGPPDLGRVCSATCGTCFGGGACCPGAQGGCCAQGEWCDSGKKCRCGDQDSCQLPEHCSAGGIIGGLGQCGSMCCGGFNNPCPL